MFRWIPTWSRSRQPVRKRRASRLVLEPLEDRCVPTVSTTFDFNTDTLSVRSDAADDIVISRSGLFVAVNGNSTGELAEFVQNISVNPDSADGPGDNLIDMSGVTLTDFPALLSETVNGQDGNDTIKFDFSAGLQIPANGITVNDGDGTDLFRISGGSASSATIDYNTHNITLDGKTISGAAFFEQTDFQVATTNLTIHSLNADRLDPGPVNGDGISRNDVPGNSTFFTDFRNPTSSLTFDYPNANEANTLTFNGLDSSGAPANVTIDDGTGTDVFILNALNGGVTSPTSATIDYNTGNITAGGQTISGAANFEQIAFLLTTTNLTIHSFGNDILDPGPVNGDGISRDDFDNNPDFFTDFRNPTNSLTFDYPNASEDNTLTFNGLDTSGAPANVTLGGGSGSDHFVITPSAATQVSVSGGDPTTVSGGDRLDLVLSGASGLSFQSTGTGSGNFTFSNRQTVTFSGIELLPSSGLLVETTDDVDDGNTAAGHLSLREAVRLANEGAGADTITFAPGLGSITLTGSELLLTDTSGLTTISGPTDGTQTIQRTGTAGRIFSVASGVAAQLNFLTISGGNSTGDGGGIFNAGTLNLTSSTLAGNTGRNGGGLFNANGAQAVILSSTLSGNSANGEDLQSFGNGGAIFNEGTLTAVNSTISGNRANREGGGLATSGSATIINCTIVSNDADVNSDFFGSGGGIRLNGTPNVTLHNTIVADNLVLLFNNPHDIITDGTPLNAASSHNLIGDAGTAGGLTDGNNGNIVGLGGSGTRELDTILNPALAANGGPTLTHALATNSPAINAGSNAHAVDAQGAALQTDQRGQTRIADSIVDIGPLEFHSAIVATGGFLFDAVEGAAAASQTVATFTDPGGPEATSNYSAVIDWGDGTPTTAGTITLSGSTFTVGGGHTYVEEGFFPINVTISHNSTPTTVASTAIVSDPAVVATGGFTFNALEGAAAASQTVATFTDPGGPEATSNYSATIDWGDGSPTTAGTITLSGSTFSVRGGHTYVEEGPFNIIVTISHKSAPATTVTSTAVVSDQQITNLVIANVPATGLESVATGLIIGIATFTDPAGVGVETPADFTAIINWGDGTTSLGTIVPLGGGNYRVDAPSHTYVLEGTYLVTVTVQHDLLPTVASPSQTIVIADQQITNPVSANLPPNGLEGVAIGPIISIATFTDPAGVRAETPADFTAIILWGDGTISPGTIVSLGGGNYRVDAPNHTYFAEGTFRVTVTVQHDLLPPVTSAPQTIVVIGKPTSSIQVIHEGQDSAFVTLIVSGQTPNPDISITSFDIFIATDGGDFELFGQAGSSEPIPIVLDYGHRYRFFSVAHGSNDTVEDAPNVADAEITIDRFRDSTATIDGTRTLRLYGSNANADNIALTPVAVNGVQFLQMTTIVGTKRTITRPCKMADFDAIRFFGGGGDDKFSAVNVTGKSIYVEAGSGTDTVTITNPSAAVQIADGLGQDKVIVNGKANVNNQFALNSESLSVNGVSVSFDALFSLTVNGQTKSDTFTVQSAPAFPVSLAGSGGTDTVFGPATANLWDITGTGAGTLNGTTGFTQVENVTGGTDTDVFRLKKNIGRLPGKIEGGLGVNTLDYSAWTSAVTVNLIAGIATNTPRVRNIGIVLGGSAGDTLTASAAGSLLDGNGGNDIITGGTGQDILIGGNGADKLSGGTGEDILIAGKTAFSDQGNNTADLAALTAVMAEWGRTDLSFDDRIFELAQGVGPNEDVILTIDNVFDDAARDILQGGVPTGTARDPLTRDWFFARTDLGIVLSDQIRDRADGIDTLTVPPFTAPTVTAPAAQTVKRGATKAFNLGRFTDLDGGPWTVSIAWGDDTFDSFGTAVAGTLGSRSHRFATRGTYTVAVTVTDGIGLSATATFTVNVIP